VHWGRQAEDRVDEEAGIMRPGPTQQCPAILHAQDLLLSALPLGQHDFPARGPARHGGNDRIRLGKALLDSP
tara:strand:- start:65 stop:280 length:216 start_codon:yes stop_codon:yes gene_type:complete